jgi:hypothetical protein
MNIIAPKVTLNNENKNDDIQDKIFTLKQKKQKIQWNEKAMKTDIDTMDNIS